jgi:divalent metal cation (Fe/Co/Zn/Cd) transporter
MNKSLVGSLAIILGSLLLSLQLYGLKIIQGLDMQKGSWKSQAIDYASDIPISLAIWITIAVIIYGIVLVVGTDRIRKLFNS